MSNLNKILWSLAILLIVSVTIVLSFWIILIGTVMFSLYGVYRHFFPKKRATKHYTRTQVYTFGEVIDLKPEVNYQTIEAKKVDK